MFQEERCLVEIFLLAKMKFCRKYCLVFILPDYLTGLVAQLPKNFSFSDPPVAPLNGGFLLQKGGFWLSLGYMEKNKKVFIGVGIAVLIVILISVAVNNSYKVVKEPALDAVPEEIPVIATKLTRPKTSDQSSTAKATIPTTEHDYDKALAQFGNKRVQFNQSCAASPMKSVYAEGESIMVDNRSDELRGVTIGTQSIVIQPYDFAVIKLFEKGSFGVNCGTQVNATTILVQ